MIGLIQILPVRSMGRGTAEGGGGVFEARGYCPSTMLRMVPLPALRAGRIAK